jgi:hypothetical protein
MVQAAAAILFGVCLAVLVGWDEAGAAKVTASIKAEADERKAVRPEDHVALTHPLSGCTAWVIHSGTPGELARPRCYFPGSAR